MFKFLKEIFIGLLTSITNASNHTKCVSLHNQKCTTQCSLINSYHNEYIQGLRHYQFMTYLITYVFQAKQKI